MYKSKLQELCQKCNWALPKYTCLKDGPDHIPQFKASVVVGGINFDTITICKSSKEAYNEAAKLAFLHFTSGKLILTNLARFVLFSLVNPSDCLLSSTHISHYCAETLNQTGEYMEEPNSINDIQSPKLHSDTVANQRNENLGTTIPYVFLLSTMYRYYFV